jgi:hypothetical protein
MNQVKEMILTISGAGGCSEMSRDAKMLSKLLRDAGVENIVIEGDDDPRYQHDRSDDELKLFVGAKPDKVTIRVHHIPWGG